MTGVQTCALPISQSHKNHKVGARLHNLIGGSQLSREPPKLRDQQGPSRALQVPKRTISRAPQVPKSNKLLNFTYHVSPWRTQTDATDAMGKNTRSDQNPSLSNPTKATMLLGGEERKNKEEHQIPPRFRSKSFPSLRREIDWWNGRSRSPLSFPTKWRQESWRDRELSKLKKVQQWRKNELQGWL